MKVKNSVEQAICLLIIIAHSNDEKPLKSYNISDSLGVSDSYLKKIIRQLVVAGLITSELHAQIIHLLGAGANGLGLELLVVLTHHLAADQSQRAVDLLVGSNAQLHAVLAGELVLKKFTEFFRCHKGTPIRISFQLC